MSVLFPFLPYDHEETPISFATRLAAQHCKSSIIPFLSDLGIKPAALLGCEDEAVEQLAAMAGVQVADLKRNSARRVANRRFNLRGNALSSKFFSSPETVFCPACLRDDDKRDDDPSRGRFGRLIWTLRPVRTCPVHGLVLIRRKWEGWDDKFRQMALIVPERGLDLDRLIDDAESRPVSNLQSYVLSRLEGAQGPAWLDSQPLEQGVYSTEMLGLRLAFGPLKKQSEMTSDEWDAAGHAAYKVTSGGEPAIRKALDQMQAEFHGKEEYPGCRTIFAPFYDALSAEKTPKDPGDFRRILRDHILETMEVSAGQSVLGVPLIERRLHSVQSLASEARLDPRSLRKVLAARGLIPDEQKISGRHVFDAKAGREVAESVLRLTHVSVLDKALNCTRPLADQLLDERLLLPISEGSSVAAGRAWKGVDNHEIERFLSTLRAVARSVDTAPAGMVTIAKAAEKTRFLSAEIVHLIFGGFLDNVARLREGRGYSAILVDPDEVRSKSRSVLVGMSAAAAFGRLKIPKATGWALVERQNGPRLDTVVIEGRIGQHRIYRFSEKTVADFMSEFTTAARIATQRDVQMREVLAHLKRARVRPALDCAQTGITFYRTEEIPDYELS